MQHQMQKQAILLFLIVISVNSLSLTLKQVSGCTCEMATVQSDCIPPTYCTWNATTSKCTHKTCDQFTIETCDMLPDYFKCAWNNGSCQTFTKCSDYSVDDGFKCFRKGPCQAIFKSNSSGLYQCTDKTNESMHSIDTCTGIDQVGCVETVQNDGKVCYWNPNTNQCEAWSNSACSNFDKTSIAACPKFSCDYNASTEKCITRTCSTITQSTACTMVWDISQKVATQCKWVNEKCIEFDFAQLDQTTCLGGSNLSYIWNTSTSKCEVCVQPDSITEENETNGREILRTIVIFIFVIYFM